MTLQIAPRPGEVYSDSYLYQEGITDTSYQGDPMPLQEAMEDSPWGRVATMYEGDVVEVCKGDESEIFFAQQYRPGSPVGKERPICGQVSWDDLLQSLTQVGISPELPTWVGDHTSDPT